MDRKMDSILRILMEQFPPKSELMAKPSIRRVTIQKRMGASIDEGPWCHKITPLGMDMSLPKDN